MEGQDRSEVKWDSKAQCPIAKCGAVLSRSDHLRRHLSRVHSLNPEKYSPAEVKRRKVEGGGFPCTLGGCDTVLSNRVHLYRHLRRVHKMEPLQENRVQAIVESEAEEEVHEADTEFPPTEGTIGENAFCVLCCSSAANSTSDDAGGCQLSNFAGEVLEEYLSSVEVRQTLQSLSVCDKCLRRVDKVLREKRVLKETEVKVRELQRQLLHEMMVMYEKVKDFWREMRALGQVVEESGEQYVETYIENPDADVVLDLRNAISSVVKDLGDFRDGMEPKVTVKSSLFKKAKAVGKRKTPVKKIEPRSPKRGAESEPVAEEVVIKTEQFSETEQLIDHDFDLSLPSPVPSPSQSEAEGGCENEREGSPEGDDDSDWCHTSDEEESDQQEESSAEDEDVSEQENGSKSGKDKQVTPKIRVKRKYVKKADKVPPPKRKRGRPSIIAPEALPSDLDTSNWSPFKLKLYTNVVFNLRNRDKALQKPPEDGIPDPRLPHYMEYDQQTDTFSVGGIPVIIHDDTESVECSECQHLERHAPSVRQTGGIRMQIHIQTQHLAVFTCQICHAVLGSFRRYKDHLATHEGRFLCSDCGKTLSSDETLRAHRWKKHLTAEQIGEALAAGEKDPRRPLPLKGHFPCDTCGKVFTQSSGLYFHQRVHREPRPRQMCAHCGADFANKTNLDYHQKYSCVPPGEQPPPQVPCEVASCGGMFKNLQIMRRHFIRVHSENAILKPFRCELCGAGFAIKNQLYRHGVVHSNERPFECHFGCGSTFKIKKHCARHEIVCKGVRNSPRAPRKPSFLKEER